MTNTRYHQPDPAAVADLVRALAAADTVTECLSRWAAEPVEIRMSTVVEVARLLPNGAAIRLGVMDETVCYRAGTLYGMRSGRPFAEVTSTVVMSRLPDVVQAALREQPRAPLSRVLAQHGCVTRVTSNLMQTARTDFAGEPQCIALTGTLRFGDDQEVVAVTTEYVYAETVSARRVVGP